MKIKIMMYPNLINLYKSTSIQSLKGTRYPLSNLDSALGYNEFDFFLENKKYRPFDGCKIEI